MVGWASRKAAAEETDRERQRGGEQKNQQRLGTQGTQWCGEGTYRDSFNRRLTDLNCLNFFELLGR